HVPGGPRGRADELAGGASDPAGGGEPQGLGRQPHLGGGTCPGSVDVRPGDVQAGRAFCPGVRQPDPARLRQSPAAAPYPARSPPPPPCPSPPRLTKSPAFRPPRREVFEDLALQCREPPLQVRAKRRHVSGSGRIVLKPAGNHFDLLDFAVVGLKAIQVAEAK